MSRSLYRIFNQGEIAGLGQRLDPRPANFYSARRVRAALKVRLRYARKTRTIGAAAALLK